MQKVRTLFISFEEPIKNSEVRAFRAAISERAGRKHILFHNHLDDKRFLYLYPKIQYKVINQQPAIICINEGIEQIHHFFTKPSWDFLLNGRLYHVKVNKLFVNQYHLNVWESMFHYKLIRWHALSQSNYEKYKLLTDEKQRIEMLEQILVGNILSFAKGIDWHVDKQIKMKIDKILTTRLLPFKKNLFLTFDVIFHTNVFLPSFIGLGKNVSCGYGIVKQIKNTTEHE